MSISILDSMVSSYPAHLKSLSETSKPTLTTVPAKTPEATTVATTATKVQELDALPKAPPTEMSALDCMIKFPSGPKGLHTLPKSEPKPEPKPEPKSEAKPRNCVVLFLIGAWNVVAGAFKAIGSCFKAVYNYVCCSLKKKPEQAPEPVNEPLEQRQQLFKEPATNHSSPFTEPRQTRQTYEDNAKKLLNPTARTEAMKKIEHTERLARLNNAARSHRPSQMCQDDLDGIQKPSSKNKIEYLDLAKPKVLPQKSKEVVIHITGFRERLPAGFVK